MNSCDLPALREVNVERAERMRIPVKVIGQSGRR
jgi:hypothetical protein